MSRHGGQDRRRRFRAGKCRPDAVSWENAFSRLQWKGSDIFFKWGRLPKKNEVERLAAIHVCRTPPSDEYIGRPIDEPNMQHVVRRIANVNCNVEEDEEHCFRVMERDVQTPFKPMYEVYMRHLLKASTQTKDICMHVVCSRCNQNDHVLQDQYVQFPGCSSINSGLSHVTSVRCRLQDVPER